MAENTGPAADRNLTSLPTRMVDGGRLSTQCTGLSAYRKRPGRQAASQPGGQAGTRARAAQRAPSERVRSDGLAGSRPLILGAGPVETHQKTLIK